MFHKCLASSLMAEGGFMLRVGFIVSMDGSYSGLQNGLMLQHILCGHN